MGTARGEDKYSGAVRLKLGRSRVGIAFVACAALATLALIAATPLDPGPRILAATWVVCVALHALAQLQRVGRIVVCRSGEMAAQAAGAWREGALCDACFVAPFLTIVRWRPAGARFDRAIVIVPDMAGREELRALRVLLRWR